MAQLTVSQHLRIPMDAGLLNVERLLGTARPWPAGLLREPAIHVRAKSP